MTRIGETVFDRVGDTLIKSAANLLLISRQMAISDKLATGLAQSMKEIEAVNTEATQQIEQRAIEIEQLVTQQLEAVRALREGQAAQAENRERIEAMGGRWEESGLAQVKDDIESIGTILAHGNYMHLIKGEMSLWAWLLRVVDVPVFSGGFGQQEAERQRELFAALRLAINELKRQDGVLV